MYGSSISFTLAQIQFGVVLENSVSETYSEVNSLILRNIKN